MEVIIAALAAGAGIGVSGVATEAVQDSYAAFKALLLRRLAGHPAGGSIETRLIDSGAAADDRIVHAAQELLRLTGSPVPARPSVTVNGGQGVMVGDGNTQHNRFG
ncbi:hypothetical protein L083_4925 [Actinoplanes sp. N902-109]|nr:hypothetical protein L083_4925 [Actinoplanes sp. N902-109]